MQTLSPEAVDTITITHVPGAPELMHADAGAELRWADHATDHQITIVRGTCRVLGRQLHAGGSAYIPAGMAYSVQAGAWGCTFFSVTTDKRAL